MRVEAGKLRGLPTRGRPADAVFLRDARTVQAEDPGAGLGHDPGHRLPRSVGGAQKLMLPPGTHRMLFACKGRPAPVDFRTLVFRVDDLRVERVDAAKPALIAVTRQPEATERR